MMAKANNVFAVRRWVSVSISSRPSGATAERLDRDQYGPVTLETWRSRGQVGLSYRTDNWRWSRMIFVVLGAVTDLPGEIYSPAIGHRFRGLPAGMEPSGTQLREGV